MTYVIVKEESEERLHLAREPSPRAWAIAVGMVALGLGAAYASVDDIIWKIAYVSGAVFIGLSWMEDWEDCILDKSTGLVTMKKQSLIQRVFQATQGQRMVVAQLEDLNRVSIQEEDVSRDNRGYVVVLHFSQGYDLGVTETVTAGDKTDHEHVAEKIRNFLNLVVIDDGGATSPVPSMSEPVLLDDNGSSTSTDESFEKIDTADVAGAGEEDSANEAPYLGSPDTPEVETKDIIKEDEDEDGRKA